MINKCFNFAVVSIFLIIPNLVNSSDKPRVAKAITRTSGAPAATLGALGALAESHNNVLVVGRTNLEYSDLSTSVNEALRDSNLFFMAPEDHDESIPNFFKNTLPIIFNPELNAKLKEKFKAIIFDTGVIQYVMTKEEAISIKNSLFKGEIMPEDPMAQWSLEAVHTWSRHLLGYDYLKNGGKLYIPQEHYFMNPERARSLSQYWRKGVVISIDFNYVFTKKDIARALNISEDAVSVESYEASHPSDASPLLGEGAKLSYAATITGTHKYWVIQKNS